MMRSRSRPSGVVTVLIVNVVGTTVSWTAPTTNTNGQTFDNSTNDRTLVGHRIYYGTVQAAVLAGTAASVNVAMPTVTYQFLGLASGTWYFRIAPYDADGDEAANTNVLSKVVA